MLSKISQVVRDKYHMISPFKIMGEGGGGAGRWVQLGWGGGMGRKGIQL